MLISALAGPVFALTGLMLVSIVIAERRVTSSLRHYGLRRDTAPVETFSMPDASGIPPARIAEGPLLTPRAVAAQAHVAGLFQTPLVFFMLALTGIEGAPSLYAVLGWAFVAARAGLAFVQLTYNLPSHRQACFWLSIMIIGILTAYQAFMFFA